MAEMNAAKIKSRFSERMEYADNPVQSTMNNFTPVCGVCKTLKSRLLEISLAIVECFSKLAVAKRFRCRRMSAWTVVFDVSLRHRLDQAGRLVQPRARRSASCCWALGNKHTRQLCAMLARGEYNDPDEQRLPKSSTQERHASGVDGNLLTES